MNSLSVGQIVRTYPMMDGYFETFEVEGINGDVVTVRNTEGICEDETWTRSMLELFKFESPCGSYEIGDDVTAYGYEGKWKVLHFAQDYRSSTQAEWNVALQHENGKTRLFYPANLVTKA